MLFNWRSRVRDHVRQSWLSPKTRRSQRRRIAAHTAQPVAIESLETRVLLTAEVRVVGNSLEIPDGDTTPSTDDGTNFGTVFLGGSTVSRSFTVFNDGDTDLATSSLAEPAGYTIIDPLVTRLAPGQSDVFTIRLDANVVGTKTGQVTFSTNDSNENVYNFTITGVVNTRQPDITVLGNGQSIADGDSTPSTTDFTDYGTATQGGTTVSRTFTVRNDGTDILNLGAVTAPTGFTITEGLVASLTPGQTDTFTVRLDTATAGTKSGQVVVSNNDPDENPFNFSIIGVVNAPGPDATVLGNGLVIVDGDTTPSTADATDFGNAALGGTPISQVYTIRNDGTTALTLSGLTVPTGFSITDDLIASLAPGESDTFVVTLDTTLAGTKTGTVSFTTNDADENPYNFSITGTVGAAGPEVTVLGNGTVIADGDATPSTTDGTIFGDVTQGGSTISRSFTVRNDGSTTLNLSGLAVPNGYTVTDSLVASLAPGQSDVLTLRLETGIVGTKSGEVSFITNDGDENPFNFSITGTVFPPGPEVTVTGNGIVILDGDTSPDAADLTDFGTVPQGGTAVFRTFTVRNDGTSTLTLSGLGVPVGYTITEPLVANLAPGASDTFTVRLDTTTAGTKSGQISFANNDTNENPFNFSITGIVSAPAPEVTVDGDGIVIIDGDTTPSIADFTDYGTVVQGGASVTRTYRVINQGSAVLTMSGLVVPIGFTITEGLSGTLAVGASDTFTVRLDTATAGTKTGQISFNNNDSDENPFNFTIVGVVNPPGPEAIVLGNNIEIVDGDTTPDTTDGTNFGTLQQGAAPIVRSFTVRNDGTTTLTLGTLSIPAGYTIVDNLVASLAPGASDIFSLRFDTTTPGTKSGSISFTTNDSNENPYNFSITGIITSPGPEIVVLGNGIEIADGDALPNGGDNTDFGTTTQGGATISRTYFVTNNGTATLTLGSINLPAGFTLTEGLVGTLAPGANDTFTVRLDTTTAGTKTGDISFNNNDSDENPYNFTIVGVVNASGPEVTVVGNSFEIIDGDTTPNSDDGTDFGSVAQGGSPVLRSFSVRNDGSTVLTLSGLAEPAGYTIVDNLVSSLSPGQSDVFTIRLDTSVTGTKTGQITFTTNDSNENPYNFTITGVVGATAPEAVVTFEGTVVNDGDTVPSTLDGTEFGTVTQGGSPVNHVFTIRNDGTATLTVGAVTVPAGFTLTKSPNSTLPPGSNDTFIIRMDTGVIGVKTGQVSFSTNDADENPYNFTISGTIEAAGAEVTVLGDGTSITDNDTSPSVIDDTDFGTVAVGATPVAHTFTIRNDGTSVLTLGSLSVPAGFSVTDSLVGSIQPGQTDFLTVVLDTSVAGTKSGQISFATNDQNENPFNFSIIGTVGSGTGPEVSVFGNGVDIPDGDATPGTADGTDFGTVVLGGSTVSRTFTVRNDGDATLTLSTLVVPTGFTITDNLVASLAPGATDSFTVRLDSSVAGTKSGEITFTTNDPNENPFNFSITGTVAAAIGPEVIVLGNGLVIVDGDTTPSTADGTDFGNTTLGGATVSKTYTVRNDGTSTLNLSALAEPAGYTITDNLVASLAPGATDTFTIRLDANVAGTKTGQVTFTTNDSDENPFNFSITGTVTGGGGGSGPEALLLGNGIEIVDGDNSPDFADGTNWGTVQRRSTPITHTFTVRNTGTTTLNLTGLQVPRGFSLTNNLVTSLAPGASDTFAIRLNTGSNGLKTGTVRFNTSDPNESPYDFLISGTVTNGFVTSNSTANSSAAGTQQSSATNQSLLTEASSDTTSSKTIPAQSQTVEPVPTTQSSTTSSKSKNSAASSSGSSTKNNSSLDQLFSGDDDWMWDNRTNKKRSSAGN